MQPVTVVGADPDSGGYTDSMAAMSSDSSVSCVESQELAIAGAIVAAPTDVCPSPRT